ncbi:MAG: FAD-dependent oxidoreductase [Nevskiales bacterium]
MHEARNKKRIVIVGFGDTGLLTAIHLPKRFEIVGISPKPCLVSGQELGTRISRPEQWKKNYLMSFGRYRRLSGVRTIHGSVTGIDSRAKLVQIKTHDGETQSLEYDALLISTGVTNGFWRNNRPESLQQIEAGLSSIHERIRAAHCIAVVGGGAAATAAVSNIKEAFPEKEVHLFCSRELPLPEYHPRTRVRVARILREQGVHLHTEHRAKLPAVMPDEYLTSGRLQFEDKDIGFSADLILWAVGQLQPNNAGLPADFLNRQGFVNADAHLRVPGFEHVFTVGDIAATDPNRCSARNKGFEIAAHNLKVCLDGRGRMRAFKPAAYRWGSILGVRNEGMRVFTPAGGNVRIRRWAVERLLFPLAVRRMIYKGVTAD